MSVGFLQFRADLDLLWALGLAFAAADALGRESRLLLQSHVLYEFNTGGVLFLQIHQIVEIEVSGNVHAGRTRHAVPAARAADFSLARMIPLI